MQTPKENKEERETFTITPSDEVFKKGDTIQVKIEKVTPQTPDSMDWEKEFDDKFNWFKNVKVTPSQDDDYVAAKVLENIYQTTGEDLKNFIKKQLTLAHSSGRREGIEEATEVFKKHYTFVGDLDTECEKELKSLLE